MEEWAQRQAEHRERIRVRRDFAQDFVLYAFLLALCVVVGWGMWRLDDRSERLFSVVAASRAAAAACP